MIKYILGELQPDSKDVKILVLVALVYFNLKDEIRDNKVMNAADKHVFEYRLLACENALKLNFAGSNKFAILPEKPERKEYE